ncbi:hypothetical protein KL935_004346 [Ogataea polymorpha]|nr:hypothetical protein KL935_004346 [Ogataea polymorpha]
MFAFILYGFEQGALANVQNEAVFQSQFGHPQGNYLGIIVAIYNLGSFFGSMANIWIGDKLGRKRAIWLGFTLVTIGVILQCSSYSVVQLFIGRFISGLGTGFETSTTPMYQSEVCHENHRGGLVAAEPQGVAFGITVSYWIGYGCSKRSDQVSWRLPVGIQMLFAVLGIVMLFFCPESPRWLMKVGRTQDARYSLATINGVPEDHPRISAIIDDILYLQKIEGSGDKITWGDILMGRDAMHGRFRIMLTVFGQFWNQFGGINLVVYYVPMVLENNVGLSSNLATILGGCIMLTFFATGFIPTLFLDKMGRRFAMASGSAGQCISMLLVTILLRVGTKESSVAATAFFFTFIGFFGYAMNCVPWVYAAEVLPLQLRAKGNAISVATNWICNFVIAMITPIMTQNLAWKTYIVFTLTNAVATIHFFVFYPETSKRTLEDIENIFLDSHTIFYGLQEIKRTPTERLTEKLIDIEHVESVEEGSPESD